MFMPLVGCSDEPVSEVSTYCIENGMYGVNPARTSYLVENGPENTVYETRLFNTGYNIISTPIVSCSAVYLGSFDHKVYSVDINSGDEIWHFETGGNIISSPAVLDGVVYVGSVDGNLYALDEATGTEKWRYKSKSASVATESSQRNAVASSPVFLNNVIYFGNNSGELIALDSVTGESQWTFNADGPVEEGPAIDSGRIYFSTRKIVYALSLDKGSAIWTHEKKHDNAWVSSPVVSNGIVFIRSGFGGEIFALDASSGDEIWRMETELEGFIFPTAPAVADGVLYSGLPDRFFALDSRTGEMIWKTDTPFNGPQSSPLVTEDTIYYGSGSGNVCALDRETGDLLWQKQIANTIVSAPVLKDGALYICTDAGALYKLTPYPEEKL